MNIALIGYGKMGQAIEEFCNQHTTHNIVARIDIENRPELKTKSKEIDVAIEFTNPEVAVGNIMECFELQIPIVSGSTGWLNQWDTVTEACKKHNGALFYSSNYSIGVNLFWEIVKHASHLLNSYDYSTQIDETHHIHKKDAPSGTAITTAEVILSQMNQYNKWVLGKSKEPSELSIFAHRKNEVPGQHIVTFDNPIDTIVIEHNAKSRLGFVQGAVKAAEFLYNKTGIYGMKDLIDSEN